MSISNTFKSILDLMRKDDGFDNEAQRVEQLSWMLFSKVFDQMEEQWEKEAETNKNKYTSPIPERCRWRNWAINLPPGSPKAQLLIAAADELVPRLGNMDTVTGYFMATAGSRYQWAYVTRAVFRTVGKNHMISGTLMGAVIDELEKSVNFHGTEERKRLAEAYEELIRNLVGQGQAGEFYTPRALTEFMVRMVNPRLQQREMLLDPACGTGGFLMAAVEHLRRQLPPSASAEEEGRLADRVMGIEKEKLPYLLCVMNLLLHGIDLPGTLLRNDVLHSALPNKDDGVDMYANLRVELDKRARKQLGGGNKAACVVTNPPFGGTEEPGIELGSPGVRIQDTVDLFLAVIVQKLLRDTGGRGAVVVTDSMLSRTGLRSMAKRLLMSECHLHTIVRLPHGVFHPYTGIKTNVLFFTKGRPTDTIWFYEHRHPAEVGQYSAASPLRVEDLEPIAQWWGREEDGFATRRETAQAWKMDFKKMKAEAEEKAGPFWFRATEMRMEAARLDDEDPRHDFEENHDERVPQLLEMATAEEAKGNEILWQIYDLDLQNPNSAKKEEREKTRKPAVPHTPRNRDLLACYLVWLARMRRQQEQSGAKLESALRAEKVPPAGAKAPLARLLRQGKKGELASQELWRQSGLGIEAFYQQLKVEMAAGWIAQPRKARMVEPPARAQLADKLSELLAPCVSYKGAGLEKLRTVKLRFYPPSTSHVPSSLFSEQFANFDPLHSCQILEPQDSKHLADLHHTIEEMPLHELETMLREWLKTDMSLQPW